jgi:hypothetical protein
VAELKTQPNDASVPGFLDSIAEEQKRREAFAILALMQKATQVEPKMWGSSLIGFGSYHYRYASGHEGDSFIVGFSPRKSNLTLYFMSGLEQYGDLLKKLGKHKTGKACLYIKRLDDIDLPTLKKLIQQSFRHIAQAARSAGK